MTDKLELQAVYRAAAPAQFTNTNRYLMAQLLHQAGVLSLRVGSTVVIPVPQIKEKTPLLWESLQAVHRGRRAVEEASKASKTARRRGSSGDGL